VVAAVSVVRKVFSLISLRVKDKDVWLWNFCEYSGIACLSSALIYSFQNI
jgi:hypothetical protein